MSLIRVEKNRGKSFDYQLKDANGTVQQISSNDALRVIIGRESQLGNNNANAKLVITETATANGSVITRNVSSNTHRVRFDASDLNFVGVYTAFFDYQNAADGSEWKTIDRQVFAVEET